MFDTHVYLFQNNVWGVAYEIVGEQHIRQILEYLFNRETTLGGYRTVTTRFLQDTPTIKLTPEVLVFIATGDNDLFLGPKESTHMAEQIVNTKGDAGPNSDYVTKMADFVRTFIPHDKDHHLFELDSAIRSLQLRSRTSILSNSKLKQSIVVF